MVGVVAVSGLIDGLLRLTFEMHAVILCYAKQAAAPEAAAGTGPRL